MPVNGRQIDFFDIEGDPDLGQVLLEELGRSLDVLIAGLDGEPQLSSLGDARLPK